MVTVADEASERAIDPSALRYASIRPSKPTTHIDHSGRCNKCHIQIYKCTCSHCTGVTTPSVTTSRPKTLLTVLADLLNSYP